MALLTQCPATMRGRSLDGLLAAVPCLDPEGVFHGCDVDLAISAETRVGLAVKRLDYSFGTVVRTEDVGVASRWVSPSKRFFPASRNSLLHR